MKTRQTDLKAKHPLAGYFSDVTSAAKNLRNTTNFYIRNTMTGILKSPEERTANETEVLHDVFTGIQEANLRAEARFRKKVAKASYARGLAAHALMHGALKILFLEYPTQQKRILNYNQLDAIFKVKRLPQYYALPAQANQQAIKKTCKSWKAYFKAVAGYKENPAAYTGRPRIPGYIRSRKATAHFTNEVAKAKGSGGKLYISFPGTEHLVCCGSGIHAKDVIKVEVCPLFRGYRVLVTYRDSIKAPEVPMNPKRILGIDLGVDNFLACAANFPSVPFLADGRWLKSVNQWYNKERARLTAAIMSGKEPSEAKGYISSVRLDALSLGREYLFRDYFYKLAHYVCRWCATNKVDVIVAGHNKRQKDGVSIGKANNQNFVQIPAEKFLQVLENVAAGYGIPVVQVEESYTSKADILSMDPLPVYGDKEIPAFSGKRIRRGLYRCADGTLINADINAAANIIRKAYPDAFKGQTDLSWLWRSVAVVTREMLVCRAPRKEEKKQPAKHKPVISVTRKIAHREHWDRKVSLMEAFGVSKKDSYTKQAEEKAA